VVSLMPLPSTAQATGIHSEAGTTRQSRAQQPCSSPSFPQPDKSTSLNEGGCSLSGPTYEAALARARLRDFDGARDQFERYLATRPDHAQAWVSYAQVDIS
jgi:TolA-binding protein